MSTQIHDEVDNIVKTNKLFRFGLELANTDDDERKDNIIKIIEMFESKKSGQETVEDKRKKMFEQIDKNVYKQKWSRLQDFHRENKLREFVEEKYKDHKNKTQLLETLLNGLKNGKLKTDKQVIYDPLTSKILEISVLVEENMEFDVKIVKAKKIV